MNLQRDHCQLDREVTLVGAHANCLDAPVQTIQHRAITLAVVALHTLMVLVPQMLWHHELVQWLSHHLGVGSSKHVLDCGIHGNDATARIYRQNAVDGRVEHGALAGFTGINGLVQFLIDGLVTLQAAGRQYGQYQDHHQGSQCQTERPLLNPHHVTHHIIE